MLPMFIKVQCSPGYGGEEIPCRLFVGHRVIRVVEHVDQWLDIEQRHFKIVGDDRAVYIVRHDVNSGDWELILFDAGCIPQDDLVQWTARPVRGVRD